MSRIIFRALVALTLLTMFVSSRAGGKMTPFEFLPFYYWFVASVFVFAGFGIFAAFRAWRDPQNRRAYLFDILLAATWVPYWLSNLR
jgi:hypothetical protein